MEEAGTERTTVGVFLRQTKALADRTLIHHHDGTAWREVTWAQMGERVGRVAARLVDLGVQPGDRVALMSPNRVEWLYCDLGIQAAGAVTVPIYPTTPHQVTETILTDSGARLLIVAGDQLASDLAAHHPIRLDTDVPAWLEAAPGDSVAAEVRARSARLRPDDVCTIVYTSGTTGQPKGVVLAHRCVMDAVHACLAVFDIGPGDEIVSFLPYSHVLERINSWYVGMTAGVSFWLSRGMNLLVDDLRDCRPTVMVSVPRVYEKMHQEVLGRVAEAPGYRRRMFAWALGQGRRRLAGRPAPMLPLAERLVLRPLRTTLTGGRMRFFVTGGAPLSREVEEFFWTLGVKILNGWGMTETSSGAVTNSEREHRFETVGKPLPGVELRIASDGEILIRAPGNMLAYFNNEAATAETLEDGWLHTGDVGELDAEGFLRITDRKKDLIKTAGGKYVAPQPMEAALQDQPVIERAVVIGDGRPYVTALIVPDFRELKRRAGVAGDPEAVVTDPRAEEAVQACVDDLNRGLGRWETIKYFTLLAHDFSEEDGELTPTLKVKRKVVQERYADRIEDMYRAREPTGRR